MTEMQAAELLQWMEKIAFFLALLFIVIGFDSLRYWSKP